MSNLDSPSATKFFSPVIWRISLGLLGSKFLHNESLLNHPLGRMHSLHTIGSSDQYVLAQVISMYYDLLTPKYILESFQSLNYIQELLLTNSVIRLSRIQLSAVVGKQFSILQNNCSQLEVANIAVHFKGLRKIWVVENRFLNVKLLA